MGTTLFEIIWFHMLLTELGQAKPVILFCNNQVALQISSNPMFHESTKHIKIYCHYIWEKIQEGVVQTKHVINMKAVGSHQHEGLKNLLGLKNVF